MTDTVKSDIKVEEEAAGDASSNAQAAASSDSDAQAAAPNTTSETKTVAAAADAVAVSDNTDKEQQKISEAEQNAHINDKNDQDNDGHKEPTDPPSKEVAIEDVYNPRNLTMDELEMLLYEWEEEVHSVNEYLDMRVIHKLRSGETDDWDEESDSEDEDEEKEEESKSWMSRLREKTKHFDDGSKTKVEFKGGATHYLNLTDDVAHVVEFYAPWCPHCQNYKWEYVEVAAETMRRSITPVEFHAVSCDVYYAICSTYEIDGFPTILGWKQGESFANRGIGLNDEGEIEPEMVAEMLDLDLAHEAVEQFDWEIEDPEQQQIIDLKLIAQGQKAARVKTAWHEHEPHTHNDRYHNAALSLSFAIKSQLFQTLTEDGKMEPKRQRALVDFLNLLDWATPQSWKLRTSFVKELQWKMNANDVKGRGDVESLIDGDMNRHRSAQETAGTEDLWGYVDASEISWTEKIGFGRQPKEQLVKDDKHWTKTCTHLQPAKGFTCGLWNLFHILTIGSSKTEHELYGFHRGYFSSPHHVAETIRNFVAYFFSCDICRTNFLTMYDDCGHDHCNRLSSEITMGPTDGSDSARMELALWLWEVHNSVNARLMKEAAQRQNREVSNEEIVASKFPTKKLCPECWLDENMTKWDNATVFRFLDEWYWPDHEPADRQFKLVLAGTAEWEEMPMHAGGFRGEHAEESTIPSSRLAMGFVSLCCLIAFLLLVIVAVQQKRRERRKKFVDSRFVKKRQSYF